MADKLSVISRAQARRMLTDPNYRNQMLGNDGTDDPDFLEWQEEWLTRIANGWTACGCRARHRGACSSQRPPEKINDLWRPQGRLF